MTKRVSLSPINWLRTNPNKNQPIKLLNQKIAIALFIIATILTIASTALACVGLVPIAFTVGMPALLMIVYGISFWRTKDSVEIVNKASTPTTQK